LLDFQQHIMLELQHSCMLELQQKRQSSPAVRNGCVSFFCHFCMVVSHTDCQGSIRSSGELIGCTIALISAAATAGRRHPDSHGKKKRNDNV
jgi:hypothetical protein